MEQDNVVEFVVDEQYENEKGVFTVLSIHRSDMVIRWESGEEMRTDIELQRNIQARRQWETLEKEKETLAAKNSRKSGAAKAAKVFEGFKETDFKNSASGTKWRGRNQLGGAVTHKLPNNRFNFNSWAFANKPEMHWLDTTHHKSKRCENCAKFFVRVNPDTMFYGFSVSQPEGDTCSKNNWDRFIQWLGEDDNETVAHTVALKNEMTVFDKNHPDSPILTPVKDGWRVGSDKKGEIVDKLEDYFIKLTADGSVNVEFAKSITKEASLTTGKEIAVDIAELFSQLLSLYSASWR